jgi:hypothetical protein
MASTPIQVAARDLVRAAFSGTFPAATNDTAALTAALACRDLLPEGECERIVGEEVKRSPVALARLCTDADALLTRNTPVHAVVRSACGVDPRTALDTVFRDASGAVINTAPPVEPALHDSPFEVGLPARLNNTTSVAPGRGMCPGSCGGASTGATAAIIIVVLVLLAVGTGMLMRHFAELNYSPKPNTPSKSLSSDSVSLPNAVRGQPSSR